jgi:hypothetical protein
MLRGAAAVTRGQRTARATAARHVPRPPAGDSQPTARKPPAGDSQPTARRPPAGNSQPTARRPPAGTS